MYCFTETRSEINSLFLNFGSTIESWSWSDRGVWHSHLLLFVNKLHARWRSKGIEANLTVFIHHVWFCIRCEKFFLLSLNFCVLDVCHFCAVDFTGRWGEVVITYASWASLLGTLRVALDSAFFFLKPTFIPKGSKSRLIRSACFLFVCVFHWNCSSSWQYARKTHRSKF